MLRVWRAILQSSSARHTPKQKSNRKMRDNIKRTNNSRDYKTEWQQYLINNNITADKYTLSDYIYYIKQFGID